MTTVTITNLPAATAAAGTDILPIVQGGITKKLTNTLLFTSPTVTGGTFSGPTVTGGLFTSPSLVSPVIGTPVSGDLSNCINLPLGTGISGFGSNVTSFLASPTSANLRSALTDETGTGVAVFATSPVLVTPDIGTPSAGVLDNCTGSPALTNVKYAGVIATTAAAPTIASSLTIAPTVGISFVSGTTAIATITAPSPISLFGGQITLIPTGLFTTTTAGNIALASTAVVGKALIMTYDAITAKWYPSY